MNPIQTDPNPKNDSITDPPEMTPVTRFSHSSQEKKRSDNRRKAARYMQDLHRRNTVGDMLYMVGFWVEYVFVCVGRRVGAVVRGIGDTVLNLLLIVLRPILIGIITLIEDLTSPFVRMASGIRHIRDIPDTLVESEDGDVRRAKKKYLASGIRKYSIVVWNAITYILPAVAAAGLVVLVRSGLGLRFVLNVQVNGENVGYVESEQVFENAREDVQSRINTAKRMLQASGSAVEDTSWDVYPTYSLSIGNQTMTESEIANAILRTASDEIINGTAVYVDDQLLYVTTEGDHLRSYLENIKAPFENAMDSSVYTAFAHNIRLVDGVYLQESVSSYADVINALTEGGGIHTYTAVDGDTVESVVNATGVSFDSLAQMNPELLTLDQEIPAGTVITTGASSAELIKVKVVRRDTETVAIPFDTQNTESDQYDFGKVVTLQEGADGSEEITYETTMIDGAVTDRQAVAYNVLQAPTPEITVTGTKLKNGMIAKVGSGSFIWPVPGYKYVSRWMGNGHRGADICAAYGTPILASDSGTIIAAGWHYSYGNYVEIDHGNGYKTLYGHMSSIAVSQGQAVAQADAVLLAIGGFLKGQGPRTGWPKAPQKSRQQVDGLDDGSGSPGSPADSGDTFGRIGADRPVTAPVTAFRRTSRLEVIRPPFFTDQAGTGDEGIGFLPVCRPQGQALPKDARPADEDAQAPASQAIALQEFWQTGLDAPFLAHPVRVPLGFIVAMTLAEGHASIPGPFRLQKMDRLSIQP